MTRKEVRNNRLKWAKGLQEPEREKEVRILENPTNPNKRCCIGHACNIFDIPREVKVDGTDSIVFYGNLLDTAATAPDSLIELLGMKSHTGSTNEIGTKLKGTDDYSLTFLNDASGLTPQEIGKLMEDWIEGGDDTPFIPLLEYPEHSQPIG